MYLTLRHFRHYTEHHTVEGIKYTVLFQANNKLRKGQCCVWSLTSNVKNAHRGSINQRHSFISPGCPEFRQYLPPRETPWTSPCLSRGLWSERGEPENSRKAVRLILYFRLPIEWTWHNNMQTHISLCTSQHCLTCSMWLTSKMEQCSLVCMWDEMWLSLYWTGMLQPANSTIFPPCALWKSNSGVFFKAAWKGIKTPKCKTNLYIHGDERNHQWNLIHKYFQK